MSDKEEIMSDDHDEIWDDSVLIKAYDKSMKLSKENLAKHIANNTNSSNKKGDYGRSSDSECAKSNTSNQSKFKIGDYVRATYEDGVDYEAEIIDMKDDENCIIKYFGYNNKQEVRLSELVHSWGRKSIEMQMAMVSEDNENSEVLRGKSKKNKTQKNSKSTSYVMPPPPPLPPMLTNNINNDSKESEHLSAMLMSWYMSGYYTGVYQGIQLSKAKNRPKK